MLALPVFLLVHSQEQLHKVLLTQVKVLETSYMTPFVYF